MKFNLSIILAVAAASIAQVSSFDLTICVELVNVPSTGRRALRGNRNLGKGGGKKGKTDPPTPSPTSAPSSTPTLSLSPSISTTPAPSTTPTTPQTPPATTFITQPLEGAQIRCYDSDWGTDDPVGASNWIYYTGADGCVTISDNQWWFEDPDYYCTIENDLTNNAHGKCFQDTATEMLLHTPTYANVDFGTISLEYDSRYCGDLMANSNGCGPATLPSDTSDALTEASSFGNQCAVHDNCYVNTNMQRSVCDSNFLTDMLGICGGSPACETLANLFYTAVNVGGEAACVASREGDATLCTQ